MVTLLRCHIVLLGQTGEQTALVGIQCHGLFHIDVLACHHGIGGNDCVGVVGSSHHDSVGRLQQFVVHLAIVIETLCLGIVIEYMHCIVPIDVAKSDDVLRLCHLSNIRGTTSTDTDT